MRQDEIPNQRPRHRLSDPSDCAHREDRHDVRQTVKLAEKPLIQCSISALPALVATPKRGRPRDFSIVKPG